MLWAALGDPRTWSCVLGHVAVCPSPGHLDLPLSYPERVGWPELCLSADAGPDQPVSADWAPLRATSSWASPWPVSVLGRPGWRDVRSSRALGAPRTVPTAALLAPTASPPGAERAEPPSADTPFRPYVPVSSVSDSNTSLREVAGSAPRRTPGGPGTRLTRRLLWDPVPCAPASRQLHEVGACGSSDDTRNVTTQTPAPGAHGPARTRHQGSKEGRLQPGLRRPRKWKRTESSWDGGGGLLQANGGGGLPPGARGSAARCRRLCCVALATVLRDMGLLWPHPRVMCPVFTPRLEEPLGDSSSTPRKSAVSTHSSL